MQRETMNIQIADDLDLDKILASGQCFRPEKRPDGWYRFVSGSRVLYIRPAGQGEYSVRCTREVWRDDWQRYFDLGRSYAALRQKLDGTDDFLQRALEYGRGIRVLRQEPWEMLITFIISQRKSIPAIRRAVNLLSERYGQKLEAEDETVSLFPTAEQLCQTGEAGLMDCGLGYRTRYVLHAAQQAASGALDLEALHVLDDAELFARLMQLDGVGKKVANCVCLFGYGRTGMVPVDVWIDRLIREEFGGHDPFPQFGQDAGIVQQYLFYYKRSLG